MSNADTMNRTETQTLRLWPGIVLGLIIISAVGIVALGFLFPLPGGVGDIALIAAAGGSLAVVVWWLFFSRAPWLDRLGAVAAMIFAVIVIRPVLDQSIAGGAMGGLGYLLTIPLLCFALPVWSIATRHSSVIFRRATLLPAMLLASGAITLLRTDGISSSGFDLRWRWTPTAEDRLAALNDEPAPTASAPKEPITELAASPSPAVPAAVDEAQPKKPPEWPGFRGPLRDGAVRGVRIETDWNQSPPMKLWSRPIGPGWSSFAVDGDLLYTQEQRGEDEIVAAYRVSTGQPVWRHRDAVRFYESNAGAGPRGTPTISNGRVYAFGATGILNSLDAVAGSVVWSRNVASETSTEVPAWGFSSSPVIVDDVVIIAAEGKLAAYDIATGNKRWFGPASGFSYSSPHLMTISGVPQVLLLAGSGATSVAIDTGTPLWKHDWQAGAIVQPAMTADGDVLVNGITFTGGLGIKRLAVTRGSNGQWSVEERWLSTGLKPYFNDFVIHKGHAFGFDGSILSSIELAEGTRNWKGGRYGQGQLVLLPEQDVLLVLSEEGELALVSATPTEFKELARMKAIEGKTWNHPVIVRDTLLVRNAEEMAAFRLSLASR